MVSLETNKTLGRDQSFTDANKKTDGEDPETYNERNFNKYKNSVGRIEIKKLNLPSIKSNLTFTETEKQLASNASNRFVGSFREQSSSVLYQMIPTMQPLNNDIPGSDAFRITNSWKHAPTNSDF